MVSKLNIGEEDIFEIAESMLKISPMSQGTALQRLITMDYTKMKELGEIPNQLRKEFIRLSILGKSMSNSVRDEKDLTETETRRHLIDPIIEILMQLSDKSFCREEWKEQRKGVYDYRIDTSSSKSIVVVEAKRYNSNIFVYRKNDINAATKSQVARYAAETATFDGMGSVILMNGKQLAVFLVCHIKGKYQPMRDVTKPIFTMSYYDATYEKCCILAYIVYCILNDHRTLANRVKTAFDDARKDVEDTYNNMLKEG